MALPAHFCELEKAVEAIGDETTKLAMEEQMSRLKVALLLDLKAKEDAEEKQCKLEKEIKQCKLEIKEECKDAVDKECKEEEKKIKEEKEIKVGGKDRSDQKICFLVFVCTELRVYVRSVDSILSTNNRSHPTRTTRRPPILTETFPPIRIPRGMCT